MSFRAWLHLGGMEPEASADWHLIRYSSLRFVGCFNADQVARVVAAEARPGDVISVEGPVKVTWFAVDEIGPKCVCTVERENMCNEQ